MTAKVCIHMEGKKTTISSPGVRNFVIFLRPFTQITDRRFACSSISIILNLVS